MGTPCNLVVKYSDDLWKTIYVSYDGYPEGVLSEVRANFNTHELAKAIVDLGDASYIDETLDKSCFYHRDRNEDWDDVAPRLSEDPHEHVKESYRYFWNGVRWDVLPD